MRAPRPVLVAALALGVAFGAGAPPGRADEDEPRDERARLLAGEVLVDGIRGDEAGGAARVRAVMWGPARALWDVVVSCEAAYRYLHGLRACEVLEDTGEHARVRQAVRRHWFLPVTEFVYRVERRPYTAMSLRLETGEVEALDGEWRFEPLADGAVRVTHEIRVDPRVPAPRWLVRAAIRGDLPDMLACIRGLADASRDAAMATRDRSRCSPPPAPQR